MKKKASALSRYLDLYERNPRSKVFAPLADVYRQLGMYQEALDVLKNGLALHPYYLLGKVVLAHVYSDTGKDRQVLQVLEPLVLKNLDHYLLQKLYAKSHLNLGGTEEAWEVLKNLQFLNPKDQEVSDLINKIERHKQKTEREEVVSREISTAVEQWARVDFGTKQGRDEIISTDHKEDEIPLATRTLVDLYQDQGITHKAIQVLEKVVELNPEDSSSRVRLESMKQDNGSDRDEQSELLDLWDEKFSSGDTRGKIKKVLLDFLHAIKLKQNERNSYY